MTLTEPTKKIPVINEYDVIVGGGGPAGIAAAIAAARNKAKTILIERYGFLGGMLTNGLIGNILTFHTKTHRQIIKGIAQEIINRMIALNGAIGHIRDPIGMAGTFTPYDPEVLKYVALQMVKEANVKLLLHTWISNTIIKSNEVKGVIVENKSGRQAILGKVTIDATGDGDIAAHAGAEYIIGRKSDGLTQPMTLMFKMCNVDIEKTLKYIIANPEEFILAIPPEELKKLPVIGISGFFKFIAKAKKYKEFDVDRDRVLFFTTLRKGEVIVNMTRISEMNGTKANDLTDAEIYARTQVKLIVEFLKKYIPGFKNSYLSETATQVGVRETRHIIGKYMIEKEDIVECRDFPDSIARGAYPIDIHALKGSGLKLISLKKGESYGIPYRCLLPKEIRFLLVAGRCISATHEASAALRVSATCFAIGEAAGTAAALAVKYKTSPDKIPPDLLRKHLIQQGAIV